MLLDILKSTSGDSNRRSSNLLIRIKQLEDMIVKLEEDKGINVTGDVKLEELDGYVNIENVYRASFA